MLFLKSVLPAGSKILSADGHGSSAWSVTARINAENPDGTTAKYFLKV